MLPSILAKAESMRCLNLPILTRMTQTTPSRTYLFPAKH
jgi:hypothetical protein